MTLNFVLLNRSLFWDSESERNYLSTNSGQNGVLPNHRYCTAVDISNNEITVLVNEQREGSDMSTRSYKLLNSGK
ncbi:hypothetical protein DVH24_034789 [Malus domestica]|uniref:Uncharacterized protein n=1 Tax=Malus domestica TaxID=3750 RepID=A0A498KP68_MALDO|nr:hypothetical protein DVH24_034789 [Malus domestica]